MFKQILFLGFILVLGGCTQLQLLPYLDQALVLKTFGQEKDAQHKYVKNVDSKFNQLCIAIHDGSINAYKTQQEIIETFGPALLNKSVVINGKSLKSSLYRPAIWKIDAHRVYIYYDSNERIVFYELL